MGCNMYHVQNGHITCTRFCLYRTYMGFKIVYRIIATVPWILTYKMTYVWFNLLRKHNAHYVILRSIVFIDFCFIMAGKSIVSIGDQ